MLRAVRLGRTFKRHVNTILKLGIDGPRGAARDEVTGRAHVCRQEFYAWFDAFTPPPPVPAGMEMIASRSSRSIDRDTILR